MKQILLVLSWMLMTGICSVSGTTIQSVYERHVQSLDGSWNYIVDPFDNGYYDYRMQVNPNGFGLNRQAKNPSELVEYNFETSPVMKIPGDWNTQDDRFLFYEGSIWFKKDFLWEPTGYDKQLLYFGAVNYRCDVYLNGKRLGAHVGGFTPFHFEVTGLLKTGKNTVVVRVNNARHPEDVPTVNFDWWNYGGITRDVMLVEVPSLYISDYELHLAKGFANRITGYVQLSEQKAGVSIKIQLPELKRHVDCLTDSTGRARFSMDVKKLTRWSPETPKLYQIILEQGKEQVTDRIGFRQIEVVGKEIRLNGKKVFLRGVSIHEEAPFRQGRPCRRERRVYCWVGLKNWVVILYVWHIILTTNIW
jgi:beta-glucuronidase